MRKEVDESQPILSKNKDEVRIAKGDVSSSLIGIDVIETVSADKKRRYSNNKELGLQDI